MESDKTNASKRLLGEGGSDNERLPKIIAKETVGKEMSTQEVPYSGVNDFSYDRGSSSSDESESDDGVVNGEGVNRQNVDIGR